MNTPPKVENAVTELVDEKIEQARFIPTIDPNAPVASTTTHEQDLQSAGQREEDILTKIGQRRINLIWEMTQGLVAVLVTSAVIYCDINQIRVENIGKAFILIIALYFIRTNHTKTGGVGGTDYTSR